MGYDGIRGYDSRQLTIPTKSVESLNIPRDERSHKSDRRR